MDFNILITSDNEENLKSLIQRAFDFGYECIALNTFLDNPELSGKKINIPEPKKIDFKVDTARKFRILNRLTAVVKEGLHFNQLLNSPVTKKYDILALQPIGLNMLRKVSEYEVDIISLDLTESFDFSFKRTLMGPLFLKGKCIEITYAPCLRDQTMKRRTISNSQLLADVTKGENLIISSGASKPLELRSVEDVVNLGMLFGLKRNRSVAAVRSNGQLVLSHAGTRTKTGCGFVSITGIINLPKYQGWIVDACKVPKIAKTSEDPSEKRELEEESADNSVNKSKKVKTNE